MTIRTPGQRRLAIRLSSGVAGALVAVIAFAAQANEQATSRAASEPVAAQVTTGTVAVAVPRKGTPEFDAALAQWRAKFGKDKVERRADGSEQLRLDESFIVYSTAQRNEDGSWSLSCGADHDHAIHSVDQREVK